MPVLSTRGADSLTRSRGHHVALVASNPQLPIMDTFHGAACVPCSFNTDVPTTRRILCNPHNEVASSTDATTAGRLLLLVLPFVLAKLPPVLRAL